MCQVHVSQVVFNVGRTPTPMTPKLGRESRFGDREGLHMASGSREADHETTGPALAEAFARELEAAARTLSLKVHLLHASSEHDFDAVFASLAQLRACALIIGPGTVFAAHSEQLAALTLRHAVPAIFQYRPFAAAGGLLSYGSSETEYYRLVGIYAGRILKGEKPGDLPVQQSTKVELIVNLKTSNALGLTVPLPLLALADEVIE